MKYCRINLNKTSYNLTNNWYYIQTKNLDILNSIYNQYCQYKKFESVVPIFDSQYQDPNSDIIGYYDKHRRLVAWSLIKRHDSINAEGIQFAWDYQDPKLQLGIKSLKNECALYKERGFEYLYLGVADDYKSKLDGFEILGPANSYQGI